jgi:hypothetical protein
MSQDKSGLNRRTFLIAVGAGGAASAAALVATSVPQAPPVASALDKRKTRGYHASEHIRNYYKTTKV